MTSAETGGRTGVRASAGRATVVLPGEVFPIEGFDGVHDPLHARALVIDDAGVRHVVVSLELPSLRDYEVERLRGKVAELALTTREDVWVGVTHTLGAPHVRSEAALTDPDVAWRNAALCAALEQATVAAVTAALRGLSPCRIGARVTAAGLNVNRDRWTPDGWTHAADPSRYSDRTLAVIRLDAENDPAGADDGPLAVLYGHDLRPSVTEHAGADGGPRLISADCTGAASRAVEDALGGVAIFLPGAEADQGPAEMETVILDESDDAYTRAEALGSALSRRVLDLVPAIETRAPTRVERRTTAVEVPMADGGTLELDLELLVLGDIALLGLRPELTSTLGTAIRAASPWPHTLVATMVNGGAKYLVDDEARAAGTRTALASPFGTGAAERAVAAAATLLHDAWNHLEHR